MLMIINIVTNTTAATTVLITHAVFHVTVCSVIVFMLLLLSLFLFETRKTLYESVCCWWCYDTLLLLFIFILFFLGYLLKRNKIYRQKNLITEIIIKFYSFFLLLRIYLNYADNLKNKLIRWHVSIDNLHSIQYNS